MSIFGLRILRNNLKINPHVCQSKRQAADMEKLQPLLHDGTMQSSPKDINESAYKGHVFLMHGSAS